MKLDKQAIQQLERALRVLPLKLFDRALASVVRYAAKPVVKAAADKVRGMGGSRGYQLLAESLGIKLKKYKRDESVLAIIGPRQGFKREFVTETGQTKPYDPVNYAHLIELGTAPHRITKLLVGNRTVLDIPWRHPGTREQPFLRPALDSNRNTVLARFQEKLGKAIDTQIRKLPK